MLIIKEIFTIKVLKAFLLAYFEPIKQILIIAKNIN